MWFQHFFSTFHAQVGKDLSRFFGFAHAMGPFPYLFWTKPTSQIDRYVNLCSVLGPRIGSTGRKRLRRKTLRSQNSPKFGSQVRLVLNRCLSCLVMCLARLVMCRRFAEAQWNRLLQLKLQLRRVLCCVFSMKV